jgi:OOP family OmpA-OmpF porin
MQNGIQKLSWILIILAVTFATACTSQMSGPEAESFSGNDLRPGLTNGTYTQKHQNWVVILDASSSMTDNVNDVSKMRLAKNAIIRLDKTIPSNSRMNVAVRTYGGVPAGTRHVSGFEEYEYGKVPSAVAKKEGSGESVLEMALEALREDLTAVSGSTAVSVVTDGGVDVKKVSKALMNLQETHGDMACIYPLVVGDSKGAAAMTKAMKGSPCGFVEEAEMVKRSDAMASYVEKVFFNVNPDSDMDGVIDMKDDCPDTPNGAPVDTKGCPLDTDKDGVLDHLDQCPKTPMGAKVDSVGCWINQGVYFDYGKSNLNSNAQMILNELADVLMENPDTRVTLYGHTDSTGNTQGNQGLSERRVKTVQRYLISKGVGKNQISGKGFGPSQPASSNKTEQGRAKNRRVEVRINR